MSVNQSSIEQKETEINGQYLPYLTNLQSSIMSAGFDKVDLNPLDLNLLNLGGKDLDYVMTESKKNIIKHLSSLYKGAVLFVPSQVTGEVIPVFFGKHSAYTWTYKEKISHKKNGNVTWLQFKKTLSKSTKKSDWFNELINEVEPMVEGVHMIYIANSDTVEEAATVCFAQEHINAIVQRVNLLSMYFATIDEYIDVQINAKS